MSCKIILIRETWSKLNSLVMPHACGTYFCLTLRSVLQLIICRRQDGEISFKRNENYFCRSAEREAFTRWERQTLQANLSWEGGTVVTSQAALSRTSWRGSRPTDRLLSVGWRWPRARPQWPGHQLFLLPGISTAGWGGPAGWQDVRNSRNGPLDVSKSRHSKRKLLIEHCKGQRTVCSTNIQQIKQ